MRARNLINKEFFLYDPYGYYIYKIDESAFIGLNGGIIANLLLIDLNSDILVDFEITNIILENSVSNLGAAFYFPNILNLESLKLININISNNSITNGCIFKIVSSGNSLIDNLTVFNNTAMNMICAEPYSSNFNLTISNLNIEHNIFSKYALEINSRYKSNNIIITNSLIDEIFASEQLNYDGEIFYISTASIEIYDLSVLRTGTIFRGASQSDIKIFDSSFSVSSSQIIILNTKASLSCYRLKFQDNHGLIFSSSGAYLEIHNSEFLNNTGSILSASSFIKVIFNDISVQNFIGQVFLLTESRQDKWK